MINIIIIAIISSISKNNDKILVCWEQKDYNTYFIIYNIKENKFEFFNVFNEYDTCNFTYLKKKYFLEKINIIYFKRLNNYSCPFNNSEDLTSSSNLFFSSSTSYSIFSSISSI